MSHRNTLLDYSQMVNGRNLPSKKNPMLQEGKTPPHEVLVERRCHAQTKLTVSPGQVGTSNATKAENLKEKFDYVHLRAPLPKDLTGSGVFSANSTNPVPESYFLMRRSEDGFVSATGLFKAAFPWATKQEEQAERDYLKSLQETDPQEVAGNVWVSEEVALDLAFEYSIIPWIEALLSNEPIELYSIQGGQRKITSGPRPIQSPPHFTMAPPKSSQSQPTTATRKARSVEPDSARVHPAATPGRPKKTPRKPRATARNKGVENSKTHDATPSIADSVADSNEDRDGEADADETDADAEKAKKARASTIDELDDEEQVEPLPENSVRVSLQEDVKDDGQTQTTHTTVRVELPASSPDLELPHDTEGVVEMAREIIGNVRGMQDTTSGAGTSSSAVFPASTTRKSMKRGRDEFEEDLFDGPEELVEELVEQVVAEKADGVETRPTKRVRLMVPAEDYRKEKVTKRALIGLSASFAFGLLIPAISTYWA